MKKKRLKSQVNTKSCIRGQNKKKNKMSRVLVNRLNVREGPSTSAQSLAHYEKGDVIASGNAIIQEDGRYWLRYTGRSGNQRYVCAWDSDGSQYVDVPRHVPGP